MQDARTGLNSYKIRKRTESDNCHLHIKAKYVGSRLNDVNIFEFVTMLDK